MDKSIQFCKSANYNAALALVASIVSALVITPIFYEMISSIAQSSYIIALWCLVALIVLCGGGCYFVKSVILLSSKVRKNGTIISAVVLNYYDDNSNSDSSDKPLQIAKLLLKSTTGEKIVYYRLYITSRKYEINSSIEMYEYNDIYLIKDEQEENREKILRRIFTIIPIIIFVLFSIVQIPYLLDGPLSKFKLLFEDNANKGLREEFKDLNYKIPEGYKLSSYRDNNVRYEIEDSKHNCLIDIYSKEYHEYDEHILLKGKCEYVDINGYYNEYDEVKLNGTTWCYEKDISSYSRREKYMINDGKNYYSISLYTYIDKDETCYNTLEEFKKTIRLK